MTQSAIEKYNRLEVEKYEPCPIERLRAFCSFAMNEQDWFFVENLFNDIKKPIEERDEDFVYVNTQTNKAYTAEDMKFEGVWRQRNDGDWIRYKKVV